jgi:hypothetical protein
MVKTFHGDCRQVRMWGTRRMPMSGASHNRMLEI